MVTPDFKGYYNAKLLITGEYLVLNGAKALAVPLCFGQRLEVYNNNQGFISWSSISFDEKEWFSGNYDFSNFEILKTNNGDIALHPQKLLRAAKLLNPEFLRNSFGCHLVVTLNYPIEWGLGSSSTLIAAIATWANVDPFLLHFSVSSGSAYDIACAFSNTPILYSLHQKTPSFSPISFNPSFISRIYFVYQGEKKDSAEGIEHYKKLVHAPSSDLINQMNFLTEAMCNASTLAEFEIVMRKHEALISVLLGVPSIKTTHFADLPGEAKSLGAWGGDFCMITWNDDISLLPQYLKERNFDTFFNFSNIVLL